MPIRYTQVPIIRITHIAKELLSTSKTLLFTSALTAFKIRTRDTRTYATQLPIQSTTLSKFISSHDNSQTTCLLVTRMTTSFSDVTSFKFHNISITPTSILDITVFLFHNSKTPQFQIIPRGTLSNITNMTHFNLESHSTHFTLSYQFEFRAN